jgi:hypothetical protein
VIVKNSTKIFILYTFGVAFSSCGLFRNKEKGEGWTVYPPLSASEIELSLDEKEKIMNTVDRLKSTLMVFGGLTDSADRADAEFFLSLVDQRYKNYKPAEVTISKLSEVEKSQILVEVFGGNWCSDTHAGVPELCKVLDLCGITSYNFEYHRVSRDKMLVDGQSRSFEITSVPLIRVYKFDSEGQRSLLGEIVEMPRISWEVDLLKILTK